MSFKHLDITLTLVQISKNIAIQTQNIKANLLSMYFDIGPNHQKYSNKNQTQNIKGNLLSM